MSRLDSKYVVRGLIVLLLVSLPWLISHWYARYTLVPNKVSIASGPEGGQYQMVAQELGREMLHRYGIQLENVATDGSGENVQLVSEGEVDLALYQSGTVELEQSQRGVVVRGEIGSIGGLYSEVVHWLKSPAHTDTPISSMQGLRIAVGLKDSGTELIALHLLERFRLNETVEIIHLPMQQIKQAFLDEKIDAAILTVGMQSPILEDLLEPDENGTAACVLAPIPLAEAIAEQSVFLDLFTIPQGMYNQLLPGAPDRPIQTVATRAHLIVAEKTSSRLTELITTVMLDPEFQRQSGLTEMIREGPGYLLSKLDFPLHAGAEHIYEPQLKPLLNVEFVEATEGIRSFVVSLVIAAFFLFKWWQSRQIRSQEHNLDRFIRRLLEIEREQRDLDQTDESDDRKRLQVLLDQVTDLRQQAFQKFTAHQINSDPAIDSFLMMCHSLSEKINAKISRQRIDIRLKELRQTIDAS